MHPQDAGLETPDGGIANVRLLYSRRPTEAGGRSPRIPAPGNLFEQSTARNDPCPTGSLTLHPSHGWRNIKGPYRTLRRECVISGRVRTAEPMLTAGRWFSSVPTGDPGGGDRLLRLARAG